MTSGKIAVDLMSSHSRQQSPSSAIAWVEQLCPFPDDDLCAVDEIAILRFPEHQAPWLLDVIPIHKADGGVLRQGTILDLESGTRLGVAPVRG
jgi:hypothetical protein